MRIGRPAILISSLKIHAQFDVLIGSFRTNLKRKIKLPSIQVTVQIDILASANLLSLGEIIEQTMTLFMTESGKKQMQNSKSGSTAILIFENFTSNVLSMILKTKPTAHSNQTFHTLHI